MQKIPLYQDSRRGRVPQRAIVRPTTSRRAMLNSSHPHVAAEESKQGSTLALHQLIIHSSCYDFLTPAHYIYSHQTTPCFLLPLSSILTMSALPAKSRKIRFSHGGTRIRTEVSSELLFDYQTQIIRQTESLPRDLCITSTTTTKRAHRCTIPPDLGKY